ncbi:M56 family metallopeptidase [Mycobacterium sp. 21AC1]|uniref:M56 family metallopeptidase n=1 Tax=[Mycobacterium] appelbergii TaxID=2939269 RepID=UPI0029390624|nr:M56 family metallopeptidase [Mycobacterium sp. 21AC1]MDV3127625.1 M56 family metallopeptidase [Mycobacterium sp. 21AC1]
MNAVTFLLVYAVTLAWLAPAVLGSRLTAGVQPRLAVAAWLATIGTASMAWIAALVILVVGAIHSLVTDTALTFCVETLGIARQLELPSSVGTAVVVVLLIVTAAVALHTARRVVVTLLSTSRSNRDHAAAAQLIGRPTRHRDVVVVDSERPTAYCVTGGRRQVIVVTTAAVERLDSAGMKAVLAHEKAHLAGRHHHIIALLNALSVAMPRVPLIRAATQAVPVLLEICADDAAARRHGRKSLLTSLISLHTDPRVPAGALAAAGTGVVERVMRLAEPPVPARWHPRGMALSLVAGAVCIAPAIAFTLCGV